MNRIRRINFFSGPCSGKSTLAAWLFANLKIDKIEAEHVGEFVKGWAFVGRPPTSFDQVYLMAKQMHREDIILKNSNSVIVVTESPLFLSVCYSKKYNAPCHNHLANISLDFDKKYKPLNIFIERGDLEYKETGRFQNLREALVLDKFILNTMRKYGMPFYMKKFDDYEGILNLSKNAINGTPYIKLKN